MLRDNWNWMSLYVQPIDTQMVDILQPAQNLLEVVKTKTKSILFDNGKYVGAMIVASVYEMFKVKMKEIVPMNIIGKKLDLDTTIFSIAPGWNWIGYPASFNMSVIDAFAGLNPENGDMVKSKNSFAIYSGYEWIGTLSTLVPGEGYMYYSAATTTKTFNYPSQTMTHQLPHRKAKALSGYFKPVENNKYPSNMTLLAQVFNGEQLETAVEVAAFVGDECRGVATSDEEGYVCLTIAGEGYGAQITFLVKIGNEIYSVPRGFSYEDDVIVGSISQPYIIQLSANTNVENTGITSAQVYTEDGMLIVEGTTKDCYVYDMLGRTLYEGGDTRLYLATGVYIVQIGNEIRQVLL